MKKLSKNKQAAFNNGLNDAKNGKPYNNAFHSSTLYQNKYKEGYNSYSQKEAK